MGSGRKYAAAGGVRSRILTKAGTEVASGPFLVWSLSEYFGFLLVLEPIALAPDVDGGGVVQQPVEDDRDDHVVGEDRPFSP